MKASVVIDDEVVYIRAAVQDFAAGRSHQHIDACLTFRIGVSEIAQKRHGEDGIAQKAISNHQYSFARQLIYDHNSSKEGGALNHCVPRTRAKVRLAISSFIFSRTRSFSVVRMKSAFEAASRASIVSRSVAVNQW